MRKFQKSVLETLILTGLLDMQVEMLTELLIFMSGVQRKNEAGVVNLKAISI